MNETDSLLASSYRDWFTDSVKSKIVGDNIAELTTPFVDRHNDHLQVYVESRPGDLYLVTDDGYILAELKSSGVDSRGSRREEIVSSLLAGHGVTIHKGELHAEASANNLGQRVHDMVQAMISLDDLFVLAQDNVKRVFRDDVQEFLLDRSVPFYSNVNMSGKSGLGHKFSFVIPSSKMAPERALEVISSPRRDNIDRFLFAVSDIRRTREHELDYYAVVNDSKRPVPPDFTAALNEYEVKMAPWSRIGDFAADFAA
ncbi:DUF1828 domain-containing protein [Actinomycetospora endophytica]|uniref:DUF1828 domain-containing protein n=1 Tax=Actinomycetospora endophytica TaxID=2291215 RepID=A0ABS8P7T1_9PSEU|nr:DUF1828 domain-containing protein [Actinomycetospora endophytica]MCD2193595.1 DUF1828 domain-containing protein [Actinomycetospora endophytica]